jgi:hypothetical protein
MTRSWWWSGVGDHRAIGFARLSLAGEVVTERRG